MCAHNSIKSLCNAVISDTRQSMLVAILRCIWLVIEAMQADDQMPVLSVTQRKVVLSLRVSA